MKKAICTLLALVLSLASVMVMFPWLINEYFPEVSLENEYIDFDKVNIRSFPFYGGNPVPGENGKNENYGVFEVLTAYKPYVKEGAEPIPEFPAELEKIYARTDFYDALYAFGLIALMTIPVYMILRLVIYNSVYRVGKNWFFPLRIFWYGIAGASASLVTVSATWLMYKTVVYDIVVRFLTDMLSDLTNSVQVALTTTNILTLVVIALLVIVLLRATLFRGSIFTSLLGAILRTALYVIIIAAIEVFVLDVTGRTMLFLLAAIVLIGLVKAIFLSDRHASLRG